MIDSNKNCFIIAEVSANHDQDFNKAVDMIREAKVCGVDAVKFQAYTPETLTVNVDNKYFRIKHAKWGGQTLYQLYQKAYTPWEWFPELKKECDDLGIMFFATAFDKKSVDMLEGLNVPIHKIASFELIDLPLIEYAAGMEKPMIMSTGMATIQEIADAVRTASEGGAKEIVLLKCVSDYPAQPEDMNLVTIPDMQERFKVSVGLSDHTLGIETSIAAVTLGASVIEKHFTLSRKTESPDSFFSLEPSELKELVTGVRNTEKALGEVYYGVTEGESKSRSFRRSLFVVEDIKKGQVFTEENVRSIRPADGLPPKEIKDIMGRGAKCDIKKGTPLSRDMVE